MFCHKCGGELPNGSRFCAHCGETQAVREKFCSQCGAVIAEGTYFCGTCGTPANVGASLAAQPAQPVPVPPVYQTPPPQPHKKKIKMIVIGSVAAVIVMLGTFTGIYTVLNGHLPFTDEGYVSRDDDDDDDDDDDTPKKNRPSPSTKEDYLSDPSPARESPTPNDPSPIASSPVPAPVPDEPAYISIDGDWSYWGGDCYYFMRVFDDSYVLFMDYSYGYTCVEEGLLTYIGYDSYEFEAYDGTYRNAFYYDGFLYADVDGLYCDFYNYDYAREDVYGTWSFIDDDYGNFAMNFYWDGTFRTGYIDEYNYAELSDTGYYEYDPYSGFLEIYVGDTVETCYVVPFGYYYAGFSDSVGWHWIKQQEEYMWGT